jgi:hypothetical protein
MVRLDLGCRWNGPRHQSNRNWWSLCDLNPIIEDSPTTASDAVPGARRDKAGFDERLGMGVVFLGRQIRLNRARALKMILTGQLANETDVKRFYNEAEATADFVHSLPPSALPRLGGPAFLPIRHVDSRTQTIPVNEAQFASVDPTMRA